MATLAEVISESIHALKQDGEEVDTGHWQGVPTGGHPDLVTKELVDLRWVAIMPETAIDAVGECEPNMPWAEDHFHERVSRVPSNPGEQYMNWPWWNNQTVALSAAGGGKFTHTYQERFWPRHAGEGDEGPYRTYEGRDNWGIRYEYGDLDDVVRLLREHPHTRQATFPIFFPEDTGAVHGGRVPCTLHYHFLLRNDRLHMWYPIRSCDAVRHFRDDVYMATRLCQWVLNELRGEEENGWERIKPGFLRFNAYSFHVHKGDEHLL